MDAPMSRDAIERLDATVQRALRERYDNVIPLVAPKSGTRRRIAPRRAVLPGAFRAPSPDRPAA
jgi:hypothetical protein